MSGKIIIPTCGDCEKPYFPDGKPRCRCHYAKELADAPDAIKVFIDKRSYKKIKTGDGSDHENAGRERGL
jgi:hypothetical protein